MSTAFTGNIRTGWTIRVNGYMLFTVVWVLFWLGMTLKSVHEVMTVHEAGKVYGWAVFIGAACILIPTAVMSFIAGYYYREDREDDDEH